MKWLHARARKLTPSLWTLIIPPTIWTVHFLFCYLWAAIRCAKMPDRAFAGFPLLVAAVTAAALLAILVAGTIAWSQERAPGDPPPHDASTDEDRDRFIAKSTLLLASLSFVAVVYTALPIVFIGACR